MSRSAKIAAVGTLGGLLMALTAGIALRESRGGETGIAQTEENAAEPETRSLHRCRTLTIPDDACEAVWATKRRRFYRQDDRP